MALLVTCTVYYQTHLWTASMTIIAVHAYISSTLLIHSSQLNHDSAQYGQGENAITYINKSKLTIKFITNFITVKVVDYDWYTIKVMLGVINSLQKGIDT